MTLHESDVQDVQCMQSTIFDMTIPLCLDFWATLGNSGQLWSFLHGMARPLGRASLPSRPPYYLDNVHLTIHPTEMAIVSNKKGRCYAAVLDSWIDLLRRFSCFPASRFPGRLSVGADMSVQLADSRCLPLCLPPHTLCAL